MSLPTTKKGSEVAEHPPNSDAIKRCFDFPESADYLLTRLIEKLRSVGLLDKAHDLVEKVREFVDIVQQQHNLRGEPWSADLACERTDFQNLQAKLAQEARESLTATISEPMKMDFALSDMSQFLRGYSVDGKPLDPALLDSCDKLFNAWLAENNLLSKQGDIYEITDDGKIRLDENGLPVKADPAKFKQLFTDPAKGFQAYLAKKSIQLTIQEHPYPEEKPKAAQTIKQKETPQASSKTKKPTAQSEEEHEITPKGGDGTSMQT